MRKLSWFWCAGFVPTNVCVPTRAAFAVFAAVIVTSIALLFATACSRPPTSEARTEHRDAISNAEGLAKIQHIVFIIKENRSFDTYFGTFPGADGATSGVISTGERMALKHAPDRMPRDLGHNWEDARRAMNDGRMDRFDLVREGNLKNDFLSMTQFLDSDIPNYWNYAEHFGLADHMFSSLAGPSFPNHLYTVASQAGGAINNPNSLTWGCDADQRTSV